MAASTGRAKNSPPPQSIEPDVQIERFDYDDEDILDLSYEAEVIPIRIKPDVFFAVPEISFEGSLELAGKQKAISDKDDGELEEQRDLVISMIGLMFYPDSARKLIARLAKYDPKKNPHPIGMKKVSDITEALFEKWGMGPTTPSGPSSDGSSESPESGNSLTENTPVAALTSGSSDSTEL